MTKRESNGNKSKRSGTLHGRSEKKRKIEKDVQERESNGSL